MTTQSDYRSREDSGQEQWWIRYTNYFPLVLQDASVKIFPSLASLLSKH